MCLFFQKKKIIDISEPIRYYGHKYQDPNIDQYLLISEPMQPDKNCDFLCPY